MAELQEERSPEKQAPTELEPAALRSRKRKEEAPAQLQERFKSFTISAETANSNTPTSWNYLISHISFFVSKAKRFKLYAKFILFSRKFKSILASFHVLWEKTDVIDRLTVLRGKGMPSLFSWSCKRSYKNGYVWNDLSENDLIYPVDGAEYVLKGSEIIHGGIPPNLERFQHLQLARPTRQTPEADEEDEAAGKHTGGDRHLVRRSRHTEIAVDDSSPPSSSSSDKASASGGGIRTGCASFRFDDGEPASEPGQTRNSVLLQLISCGTMAVKSGRTAGGAFLKSAAVSAAGRKSTTAAAAEEAAELHFMSEKEYFSGSIVEGIGMMSRGAAAAEEPALKKSSSYNEERGAKLGIGADEGEENGEELKVKCIPGRKRSLAKQQ